MLREISHTLTRKVRPAAPVRLMILLGVVVFIVLKAPVTAQDTAPPPLKLMTKSERSILDAVPDIKGRTRRSLELMDDRLVEAEKYNSIQDYAGLYRELGGFHALMDDSLAYLRGQDPGSKKVLDGFKRIEMRLREFAPRIEMILRDLPLFYEEYPRKLAKFLREARSKATDPQFADTVIPSLDQ